MSHKILRLPELKDLTGLSRSTIYARISNEDFPAPISLGGRAVGWIEEDVMNWIEQQIEASRSGNSKRKNEKGVIKPQTVIDNT